MLDDIETETRTLSRSALRHRPITPDALQTQVQTRRASRAQKREPYSPDDLAFESPPPAHSPRRTRKASRTWLIYVVLGMLAAMLLLWLGQIVWNWAATVSDDIRYGRPRTTQVDHFVGHETGNTPTHFIATNVSCIRKIKLYTRISLNPSPLFHYCLSIADTQKRGGVIHAERYRYRKNHVAQRFASQAHCARRYTDTGFNAACLTYATPTRAI
jgi:hypothetical protein